ncbi:MAG: methyltransferase domain-containing protein [Dactylosporangium sp.]|nr:methyltransferase domain-containing protein [Dactylosporangium sp.]NNJ60449.1 methyltransferase domain-containing protein [Dactylosporangium sp.]
MDPYTFSRLSTIGDLKGKRCLEVGAGGGSVARWMVDQVGPDGRVLATDLNICRLSASEGYQVQAHNLVTDPVPEGPWDLIHARMVLLHIPERAEILRKLIGALADGGSIVTEDWATEYPNVVLAAPDEESAALVEAYHVALTQRILPSNGNDPTWARRTYAAMLAGGLVDVDTDMCAQSWPGGTAGALLIPANIGQVRDHFLAEGFTEADLDRLCALAHDPRLVVRGHFHYSTIGRRPGVAS